MRQVFLDTETTGFEFKNGDRIIEIGVVEAVNRTISGENFHIYINPEREIPEAAIKVHGITNDFIKDKPVFNQQIAQSLIDFIKDSQVIIHNASFDLSFLNGELQKLNSEQKTSFKNIESYCEVIDSLKIANEKFLGSRNNLDALCKRFGIDNSTRELHGALLDADLLAQVYLEMTGGQTSFEFEVISQASMQENNQTQQKLLKNLKFVILKASATEEQEHLNYLQKMQKSANGNVIWTNSHKGL